jgi:ferredoxin
MIKVVLTDTNKSFEVRENEILYDALFDRGEELPHGCLSGSCGACRVEVMTGAHNLQPASFIENNTLDCLKDEFTQRHGADFIKNKEIRLACRAKVMGDVTIRPIK